MGILRYIVVGAVAFALLPTPPVSENKQGEALPPVAKLETHELLSAAIGTVADLATFCARQPQTCEAMASVASVAEAKAKYSFKLAYEWANGQPAAKQLRGTIDSNGISDLLGQPVAPAQANLPCSRPETVSSRSACHRQHNPRGRKRHRNKHAADRRPDS
jgi:hypothetical protein